MGKYIYFRDVLWLAFIAKMVFCPDSGGWSDPKPNSKEVVGLPKYQLYDLSIDPSEKNNLYQDNPDIADEMERMMVALIHNGRSTTGTIQQNDPPFGDKEWKQVAKFCELVDQRKR